ncbi:MAG: DUF3054 domain-containing protein [Ilumatobacteraceae bacterium]|nr:DUF3054 domain-containing protein [Ilumatobacteraceae bacterium]
MPLSDAEGRANLRPVLYDMTCVLIMVLIGTRNHDQDTGVTGVLGVAAPFWIAVFIAWIMLRAHRSPRALSTGASIWVISVSMGMALRHFVWNRGTAVAFVVVATIFLGATMMGWRTIVRRSSLANLRH